MRFWLTIPLFSLLAASSGAHAQTPDTLAESLFRDGKKLFEAGRYEEACPKLVESYRLTPRTGTLLANAVCHEAEGKLATAWSEYAGVAARARSEHNAERERHAREKVQALGTVLSTVTLSPSPELAATDGLEIELDGAVLGKASLGTPLPLDGGPHHIVTRAPGKSPATVALALAASGERRTLVLEALSLLPTPEVAARPSEAEVVPALASGAAHAPDRRMVRLRRSGIAVASVGVAVLAVSAGAGIRALRKHDASKEQCDANRCTTPEALDAHNQAYRASRIANYTAIAGGVALAGGAALLAVAILRARGTEQIAVAPEVTRNFAGFTLQHAF